ncbi:hypothetical protein ACFYY8_09640 [Streptosporangium sp. NPDC001559]|uniref:hypothetical protein n=1 Tax=Streptosporangium sp. NPDC001559 TaxID=3366187 RepID=UPI0036E12F24
MATPEVCSPVSTLPGVFETGPEHVKAGVTVETTEAVFAGHYPGRPILPGMCVVEYVRLAALANLPETPGGWRLAAIESGRFLSPVLPEDRLVIDCVSSAGDTGPRCSATVSTERGVMARVRLRFEARRAREESTE